MGDPNFHSRIKDLYRMLFEMATGNLSFRLPPEEGHDDLSRLLQSLSAFAAQFQLAIKKSGYVVPYYTFQNLTQSIFLLDHDLKIIAFSSDVPHLLSRVPDALFHSNFDSHLDAAAAQLWQRISTEIGSDPRYQNTVQLQLITSKTKVVSAHCTISRLLYTDTVFISSISTNLL